MPTSSSSRPVPPNSSISPNGLTRVPEVPNEATARELAKLPEEEQTQAWKEACGAKGGAANATDLKAMAEGHDSEAEDDTDDEPWISYEDEGKPESKPKGGPSKGNAKNGGGDLAKTSGKSPPPSYKIVIDCDLRDTEVISEALGNFDATWASAKGNKYSGSLEPVPAGELLKSLGQQLADLKGSVTLTMKGVA